MSHLVEKLKDSNGLLLAMVGVEIAGIHKELKKIRMLKEQEIRHKNFEYYQDYLSELDGE